MGVLMFPDANDLPPGIDELAVGVPVPGDVPRDLASPELGIPGRRPMMFDAPVPETTIKEHSDLRSRENQIGSPTKLRQRLRVNAVSQTQRVYGRPQSQFRTGVLPPVAPHY